ncbi:hypothetical protein E2C01_084627 [Portunus trituberculatus]|uniref:Uncharacterized protein n=1 Tax=Portunus trituberculatus TaxID=210409 RepID=A0A5B7J5C5_PORTR|nr:hypothetical protein [Portunus trituberculatus]
MMVALMDSLYAALGLFIHDAKQLPLMVHKQVRKRRKQGKNTAKIRGEQLKTMGNRKN